MEIIETKFKSRLELKNIYVSETNFTRKETLAENVSLSFKFDHKITDIDGYNFKVELSGEITSKDDTVRASATVVGLFELQIEVNDENAISEVKNGNTIAIMFPYLRSQLVLVSSQSGVVLTLPAVNINSYFEKKIKSKD